MKYYFHILISTMFVILVCFSMGHADESNYMSLKPGMYSPQSSDLKNFDKGFNWELSFGHQYNSHFAAEMAVGTFMTKANAQIIGQEIVQGTTYHYTTDTTANIKVMPITVSLKGIIPVNHTDFYGMMGIGLYSATARIKASGSIYDINGNLLDTVDARYKDTESVFGFHAGVGFNYNLNSILFVGAEAKYLFASEAKFNNFSSVRLDGILGTAIIGFRF